MFKHISFVSILLCSAFAVAQTGTVERVRGSQAIVKFPGKAPKVGDQVSIGTDSSGGYSSGGSRARKHGVRYAAAIGSVKVESGNTSATSNITALSFEYLRNFGTFELGGGVEIENSGSNSSATAFRGIGQYNFSENKPRTDIVPYARGSFGMLSGKSGGSSSSGTELSIGGGANWFPFSDLFAVDLSLAIVIGNSKANNVDIKTNSTLVSAGWRLYF